MLDFPDAALQAMDEGREHIRGMIRFDLGGGSYGFIKASVPMTWNGLTYRPFGLIEVSELASSTGTSAKSFTVSLAESPDNGLTPDLLSVGIENEDYRDRAVTVYDAMFDPDTGALLTVETMQRGYIDQVRHEVHADKGYVVVATCESRALDYSRIKGRQSNSADQARRDATDTFFDHAAAAGTVNLKWGK